MTTRPLADAARIRVVYLDHCAQLSGAELALVRLLGEMPDVDAVVLLAEDGPLVHRLEQVGAQVEVFELDRAVAGLRRGAVTGRGVGPRTLASTVRHVWRLRRRLRELQPDVVHTNSMKANIYGGIAGRLAGIPVVWHVHDRIARDYFPVPAVVLVRVLAALLPTVVMANSKVTAATLPWTRRTIRVVHSPIESVVDRPPPIRDHDLVVAMVGRLAPWKGQDVFLRAFAAAFAGGTERAELVGSALFGEEEHARSLHALVDELGLEERVRFTGFVEDVHAHLRAADLLVHASVIPEPFGQVVLDGLAAGVPVIASVPGGPGEILTDGEDGVLVPSGDVPALAAAMAALLADPVRRRRLAEAGLHTARRHLPDRIVPAVMAVYESVRTSPRAAVRA